MKQKSATQSEKDPFHSNTCNAHDLRERARDLRKHPTEAEAVLWSVLRHKKLLSYKFRRQHPIPPYIVDFFCHSAQLAIEVDGGKHSSILQNNYDEHRDRLLNECGVRVLRFSNEEVLHHLGDVIERIKETLRAHV